MDSQQKHCLNCGSEVDGNFCPRCGQSTAIGRLDFKSTARESVATIARVDRGFLYTAWLLISRPWIVIKDYIRGRRVPYAPPVKMMVVLCLFSLLGDSLVGADSPEVKMSGLPDDCGFWPRAAAWTVKFYLDSMILQSIVVTVVAALAVYVVYLRHDSRRYNLAEYFTAGIYLCDASIAVQILLLPLWFVDNRLITPIVIAWCGVLGILSVVKTFHIKNYGMAFFTFAVWGVLFVILLAFVHAIPLFMFSFMFGLEVA